MALIETSTAAHARVLLHSVGTTVFSATYEAGIQPQQFFVKRDPVTTF